MRELIKSLVVAGCVCISASASGYEANYQLIDNPDYPTTDLAVSATSVTDWGCDKTGNNDCTALVQQILDTMAGVGTRSGERGNYENLTGGVLYFPEGRYRFDGRITIPRGVTIRGDWRNPDTGGAASGTIFIVNPAQWVDSQESAFITMQPCTEVSHISFWYPGQRADNVRPAPPTILMGQTNYWGNEYCNVRFCTFYNSYTAVKFNEINGGGCPNIFEVYGTPLHTGIEMDRLADVGRLDHISFAPRYWAGSRLADAPAESTVRAWLRDNATGIIMRRNDWTYTCNFEADGYKTGYRAEASPQETSYCPPNGHHYNFTLTDCRTGIELADVSYTGIMFTRVSTTGCDTGVRVAHSGSGPAQFYGCEIGGTTAIEVTDDASTFVTLQDCSLSGPVNVLNGHFQSVNSTYASDLFVSAKARCILSGNRFTDGARLNNNSLFECKVSDIGPDCRPLPAFADEWMAIKETRPARKALYVVTGITPLHVTDNPDNAADCTAAIQNRLNEAGNAGGGIVYIPQGHYRLNGTLTIPAGVELKGASDLANVPHGQGTIFEAYSGHGDENGTPFITMAPASGLRGITVNYPRQTNSDTPVRYPYTIRGNRDCYIVNVALRAAYRGVDLFTNRCDNHYVDYLGGHAFMNVIRVGGDSQGGVISNIQFNTIAYACGDETKFGAWPNSIVNRGAGRDAYVQNPRDLDFFIIGDCRDQVLYNNFLFGCNKGMVFQSDGHGGAADCHSLGNAVDDAVNTFVFNAVATDLDLINSQVVALNHGDNLQATFVTAGPALTHTVTMFASDHWGSGNFFADIKGGTVNLYSANMNQSGTVHSYSVPAGRLNLVNSVMQNVRNFVAQPGAHEQRLHVYSSTLDPTNSNSGNAATWTDNLPHAWTFVNRDALLPRDGWKATAFNDPDGTNQPSGNEGNAARSAIDGNDATRWDSRGSQTAGQWFRVDFGKPVPFNAVIIDTSASGSDGAAGYTIEVLYDNTWHRVAEGSDAGAVLVETFPEVTASAIRINQTGSKSNYWSIHEFNISNATIKVPEPEPTLLARDGWKATAFNDPDGTRPANREGPGACSAIDGDDNTRWDTQAVQTPGQWFRVDFGRQITFDTVILDTTGSVNDGPAGYSVEVYYDNAWHQVAEGVDAQAVLTLQIPAVTASAIRINQTGSKNGLYWSIHEFNLAATNVTSPTPTGLGSIGTDNTFRYADRALYVGHDMPAGSAVSVYTVSGTLALSVPAGGTHGTVIRLDNLAPGIYVAVLSAPATAPRPLKISLR